MNKKIMVLTTAALLVGVFTGCGKEEATELSAIKTDKYVTLGEYSGFTISAEKTAVSDEEIMSAIQNMLSQNVEPIEVTDKVVENGDTVNIDFVGKLNGEAFEGGTASSYDLVIGSGSFIEGFEEGLVGVETGATKDLHLVFPENYGKEELNGQEVVFTVTVNSVKVIPELSDEIVPQLNAECKTIDELKAVVTESLTQQAEYEYDTEIENMLIEQLREGAEFKKEPPAVMIDQYVERSKKNLEMMASYYGMSFTDMLSSVYQVTEEEFMEQVRPGCVESAQTDIMLQTIANKAGLNPTQEDIDAAMQKEATEMGYESVEAYKEVIDTKNYKDYVMVKNVLNYVKENSTVTEE